MSKIALRVYVREIETLIDQGHIEEAVAHCQHILKTYPKHLDTYRMLGKAYLEARRYPDASEIFTRVLLASPNDFVSHLGLSIIRDEQKDLDAAIWHMERAFESNPSNPGVNSELRRLYGRRDGMEPPKIRLTRGALAQMYTKGGQYAQAIAEIKSVLSEDPGRTDLKNLLAWAYYRAGQKADAGDVCNDLLKTYPYELDANRIMVEILSGANQDVSIFKKRITALDPYAGQLSGSLLDTDTVPDNAVVLDRLDWDPDQAPAGWNAAPAPAPTPISQPQSPAPATEQIPDWMRAQGWGPSTGEFQDGPMTFDEPEPPAPAPAVAAGPLVAAEIPDWLKSMAPPGATAPMNPPVPDSKEVDLDFLSGLGAPASPTAQPEAPAESASADLDWLSGLGAPAAPASGAPETDSDWLSGLGGETSQPPSPAPASAPEAAADWLSSFSSESAQPAEPASNIPDWMSGLGAEAPSAGVPAASEPMPDWLGGEASATPQPTHPSAQPESDLSAWLSALDGQPQSPSQPSAPSESTNDEMDWLGALGMPTETPASDHVQTAPAAPAQDEAADWLQNLSSASEESPAAPEEPPAAVAPPPAAAPARPRAGGDEDFVPGPLSELVSGPGTSASEQDAAMNWLEMLAMKQGAKAEELITKPDERREDMPDWVGNVGVQPDVVASSAPAAPVEPPIPGMEEANLVIDQPAQAESTVPEPSSVPAWTEADDRVALPPAPVQSMPWETPSEPVAEAPALETPGDVLPDWLAGDDEAPVQPVVTMPWEQEAPEEEIPAPSESTMQEEQPPAAPVPTRMPWEEEQTQAQPMPWEEPPVSQEEIPAEQAPTDTVPVVEDVSAWLKQLDQEEQKPAHDDEPASPLEAEQIAPASEETPSWVAEIQPPVAAVSQPPSPDALPDWLKEEAQPAAAQPPAAESTPPPAPPRDFSQVAAALRASSAAKSEPVARLEKPAAPPPPEPTPAPVETPKPAPRPRHTAALNEKDGPALQNAQQILQKGDLNAAMAEYAKLIKRGKLLEDVIYDLQEATYSHPVDVVVWHTLGDAYMRSNRMQEALDAYTKAEELLRR